MPKKKKKRKENPALTRLGMNMGVSGTGTLAAYPLGPVGFRGVASFDWACSGTSHSWWLDWDLGSFEAWLMPWALCCVLQTAPEQFFFALLCSNETNIVHINFGGFNLPQPVCTQWGKEPSAGSGKSNQLHFWLQWKKELWLWVLKVWEHFCKCLSGLITQQISWAEN